MNSLVEPYNEGKCVLRRELWLKTGVYFIYSKSDNRLLYVGMSVTNLYLALYRHFQVWSDRKNQYRAKYRKNEVLVSYELRPKEYVVDYECLLILELNPPDNREYYLHWNKYKKSRVSTYNTVDEEKYSFDDLPF